MPDLIRPSAGLWLPPRLRAELEPAPTKVSLVVHYRGVWLRVWFEPCRGDH